MAITDKKVSETYAGRDISSLSDRPNQDGLTGAQLKARFDQLGKEVIPNYNDLIDELNDVVLPAKADQATTYTKTEADNLLGAKVDKVVGSSLVPDTAITDLTDSGDTTLHKHDTMYYTEGETDTLLLGKADAVHTHLEADITDLDKYTQSQTDTLLLGKVDVVVGKGLSTNDFTDDLETKLNGIEALAEVNNISDVNATDLTDGGDSTLHYHSADRYTLPVSTDTVLGGVKVGSRLSIADGVLSADVQTTDISGKVDKVAGSSLVPDTAITDLTDGGDTTLHIHTSDRNTDNHTDGTTNKVYSATDKSKLAGIETGAEVNNISDTNATDLTDGGDSSLHYHSADRSVDNHTDGSTNKLFTATLKTKLDGIAAGAVKITISADAPANPNTNDLWLDI